MSCWFCGGTVVAEGSGTRCTICQAFVPMIGKTSVRIDLLSYLRRRAVPTVYCMGVWFEFCLAQCGYGDLARVISWLDPFEIDVIEESERWIFDGKLALSLETGDVVDSSVSKTNAQGDKLETHGDNRESFWDCECPKSLIVCPDMHDECPDSREEEVQAQVYGTPDTVSGSRSEVKDANS